MQRTSEIHDFKEMITKLEKSFLKAQEEALDDLAGDIDKCNVDFIKRIEYLSSIKGFLGL